MSTAMTIPSVRTTRVWKLKHAPETIVTEDTFEMVTEDLPEVQERELLLQAVYFSNDPAQRGYIDKHIPPERLYVPPVLEGQLMACYGVCKVLVSKSQQHSVGSLVLSNTIGWREYAVTPEDQVRPIPDVPGASPSVALGSLGGTALTAWFGLHDVCHTKAEHVVLISGAAGATGSAAIQIAKKIIGAKCVIGIAGGPQKCAWVETLGADICIDYKAANFEQALKSATAGYVDVYLDMVGGEILNTMLTRMKPFGQIAAIGSISTYNDRTQATMTNWFEVISNRITISGFIVLDFRQQFPGVISKLVEAVQQGKFILEGGETIREVGFERVPEVWRGLFDGSNTGKLVTKLI